MIEARSVNMAFGPKQVLKDFSLDISDGSVTVIIGRSGIGKSVFLKCTCGLLKPGSGAILIDGEDIVAASPEDVLRIRSKIGMLFQEGALFDGMTVYQNIAFPLEYKHRYSRTEIEARVLKYAEIVELRDALQLVPKELSGGMKRRVAIARAMIYEPKYLFYDEPTTGLDPATSANVELMIRRLNEQQGITSVIVTHDIDLAEFTGTKLALLEGGTILAAETRDQAFRPESPIYQNFINTRKRIRVEQGY